MQNNKNVGMIFISGAGLHASIWDKVRSQIGVPSIAINFPNRSSKISNKNLSLDDYINETILEIDKAFSISFQERMVCNLKTKNVKTIESGHLPMVNKSDELAEILNHF